MYKNKEGKDNQHLRLEIMCLCNGDPFKDDWWKWYYNYDKSEISAFY